MGGKLTLIPEMIQGSAINSSGFVVGYTKFFDGVALDLNTFILASDPLKPYVTLADARGINDTGLVIVNGYDSRASGAQAYHAYLLQVPLIRVTPGPLAFLSQKSGSVSAPQTVTFTNEGATALSLGRATVSSGFSVQSNTCGSSLAPGIECAITVAYAPVDAGSASGNLTLGAGGVPIAVPLSGSSPLSVSISVSSTTATVGEPVMLTWTASGGAACTATGGSAADGWTGTVPDSGSRAVTESTGGTYTYGISCTAASQTEAAKATPVVVSSLVGAAPPPSRSGGGAFDPAYLAFLSGLLAVRQLRRIPRRIQ